MQIIKEETQKVFEAFYTLTDAVSQYAPFDEKQKELILCAIFATHGTEAIHGLGHHVLRASELGATREEILGAILLILPVVGISHTTLAMKKAEEVLHDVEQRAFPS